MSSTNLTLLTGGAVVILSGTDLFPGMSINDFFKDSNYVAFFYNDQMSNIGHWVLVSKKQGFETGEAFLEDEKGDTWIEYFDPLGLPVDEITKIWGEPNTQLKDFLESTNLKIRMTDKAVEDRNHNTCGRHVVMRWYFRDFNLEHYIEFLNNTSLTPDQLVTLLSTGLSVQTSE